MLANKVFETIADRFERRADEIALFLEANCGFEPWCVWEAFAACRGEAWNVQAEPGYATVGLMGSREHADLLVSDRLSGSQTFVELALVTDWTTNRWIAALDLDTHNLSRPLANATPLQLVFAASPAAPIEVNPTWNRWLGMTEIWREPTSLRRTIPLGGKGEGLLRGWIIGASSDADS